MRDEATGERPRRQLGAPRALFLQSSVFSLQPSAWLKRFVLQPLFRSAVATALIES